MISSLVEETFQNPEKLIHHNFIARKLMGSDAYLDYMAVMSSIDIIRKTRGGDWPTPNLSFEDDFIDLCWHQREFENKSSFAFTVFKPDETECLGCFYLYQPGFRAECPANSDVDISFWVTQTAYNKGLYQELYFAIKKWLDAEWPFKHPYWTNTEIPE